MSSVTSKPIRLLLVEDNPGDAEYVRESLRTQGRIEFIVTHAEKLQEAVKRTSEASFDLILLDLFLPDSQGLDTVVNMREQIPDVPVVVLSGVNDDILSLQAIQEGAQDYVIKGQIPAEHLTRTLRYAITRHIAQEDLKSAAMTDELTGLYNRRGFLTLAGQQLKLAQHLGRPFLLLYIDLDKFKEINDTFGHLAGDRALRDTAEILRKTFRDSDIVARLGGDEFVIALLETSENDTDSIKARLQHSFYLHNVRAQRPYQLQISIGAVQSERTDTCSIEEMLDNADSDMYFAKRKKNKCGSTIHTISPIDSDNGFETSYDSES